MSVRMITLSTLLMAVAALLYWQYLQHERVGFSARKEQAAFVSNGKLVESWPYIRKSTAVAQGPKPFNEDKALNVEPGKASEADEAEALQAVKQLINHANMNSITELKSAFYQAQDFPSETMHAAILDNYEDVKTASAFARTKLLWFAKRQNGPKLQGMWQDILLRKTSEGPDFDTLQASHQHPSITQRAEVTEELIAVKALGQLAKTDQAALQILKKIASGEGSWAHTTRILRKTALEQIKNCSYTSYIQTKPKLAKLAEENQ